MKVKAIKRGYYGDVIREVGDVFEYEGKKLGSWMEPLEKPKPAPPVPPAK